MFVLHSHSLVWESVNTSIILTTKYSSTVGTRKSQTILKTKSLSWYEFYSVYLKHLGLWKGKCEYNTEQYRVYNTSSLHDYTGNTFNNSTKPKNKELFSNVSFSKSFTGRSRTCMYEKRQLYIQTFIHSFLYFLYLVCCILLIIHNLFFLFLTTKDVIKQTYYP